MYLPTINVYTQANISKHTHTLTCTLKWLQKVTRETKKKKRRKLVNGRKGKGSRSSLHHFQNHVAPESELQSSTSDDVISSLYFMPTGFSGYLAGQDGMACDCCVVGPTLESRKVNLGAMVPTEEQTIFYTNL